MTDHTLNYPPPPSHGQSLQSTYDRNTAITQSSPPCRSMIHSIGLIFFHPLHAHRHTQSSIFFLLFNIIKYSLIYRSKKQIKSSFIIMVTKQKNQLATSTRIAIKQELNKKTQMNPPQKEQNQKPNHVRSTRSQIIQSTKDIAKPKV